MTQKLMKVVQAQLTQGVTPRGLALSCALTFVCGTFPIFGVTTLLCFLCGLAFKLNQPITLALNYLLTPVHLILIPVFLRIGEWMLSAPAVSIHPSELVTLFYDDWRLFLARYGLALLHAILAWILIAPVCGVGIYFVTKPLFERLKIKLPS